MKSIRLSPKKLDRAADEYFEMAHELETSDSPHPKSIPERMKLAGLALRRWAVSIRADRIHEKSLTNANTDRTKET